MVDINTDMTTPTPLGVYLRRVVQRPRAWALSYLVTTLLALGLALLTAMALLPFTRYPAFARLLETRSLDWLLDFSMLEIDGGSVPFGIPVLLALPVWILARLIWTWLEGGTLAEYAAAQTLSWRAFAKAGWQWLGVFLALNLIGAILVVVIGGVTLLLAIAAYLLAPALGWAIGVAGLAVAGLVATWIEVSRAAAVTQNQRGVFHALGNAARALFRQAAPLMALVIGGLALYGLLFLAHRGLMDTLPLHWWLPTLLVQQAYTLLRLGIRLARQAGQVGLLSNA
ncbi:MAG: hypothetical protein ACP5J4_13570 [Anaerolineae bacterium]